MAAERQLGGEAVLERGQPPVLEPGHQPDGELLVPVLDQRRSPPQGVGFQQDVARLGDPALGQQGAALVGENLETAEVDVTGVDGQPVTGRLPAQQPGLLAPSAGRFELTAQARDVALERAGGRRGRVLPPQDVDQRLRGDHPARRGQEHGQHRPRLVAPQVERSALVVQDGERAQQAEPHADSVWHDI